MATLASRPRPTVAESEPDGSSDRALAAALARAFVTDPVVTWLIPDAGARLEGMAEFFLTDIEQYRRRGQVWAAADGGGRSQVPLGGALWAAPDQWKVPTLEVLQTMPTLVRCFGRSLPKLLRFFTTVEARHPRAPHWYLAVLGADPIAQGRGVGTALLEPVLERCDREGTAAYLESSKDRNVPYYRRFGFEVTTELRVSAGAPPIWPMWRDPR